MPPAFNLFGTILSEAWEDTDVTPGRVAAWLDANKDAPELVVNISSPGSDAFAGNATYNLLMQHPARIVVNVLGLASSAASTVMMAGDEIIVSDGAFVMIHNVSTFTYGDASAHRTNADRLETHNASIAAIYAARTGMNVNRFYCFFG
jgi:ATP-dependent protease ClpP protease subunit